MTLLDKILMSILTVSALYGSYLIAKGTSRKSEEAKIRIEFEKTCTLTLVKHADTNFDAIISPEEKTNFYSSLYARNNATFLDGKVISNNTGNEVPLERIIEWLKKYK